MTKAIHNATILTPHERIEKGSLLIQGDTILDVGIGLRPEAQAGAEVIDAGGMLLIPGLIDLHTHGLAGHDVMGAGLPPASGQYPAHGITSYFATTLTAPLEILKANLRQMASSIRKRPPGAVCLGIHLEGPFLSPRKPGIANPEWFLPPSLPLVRELQDSAEGHIKRLTFAPELVEDAAFIPELYEVGITPVAGHTAATFEQMRAAFSAGLRQVAHLFNAMPPLHQRSPGAIGAALLEPGLVVEVIADGVHVHPAVLDLLLRIKGPDEVMLVSDSSPYSGLPEGEYEWAGQVIKVDEERCTLPDGTLAGSYASLDKGVMTMVREVGLSLEQSVQMATTTPAAAAGVSLRGQIAPGVEADLVLMDHELRPQWTMVGGKVVWRK